MVPFTVLKTYFVDFFNFQALVRLFQHIRPNCCFFLFICRCCRFDVNIAFCVSSNQNISSVIHFYFHALEIKIKKWIFVNSFSSSSSKMCDLVSEQAKLNDDRKCTSADNARMLSERTIRAGVNVVFLENKLTGESFASLHFFECKRQTERQQKSFFAGISSRSHKGNQLRFLKSSFWFWKKFR